MIVHQLTALGAIDMRHFDRDFALTNRLRTEGTDHLLAAGQAVGVRRFVAQSVARLRRLRARAGGPVKTEDDPLDSDARARDARDPRRDPPPRGGGPGRPVDRGDRAALRRASTGRARRSRRARSSSS